jgi:hypothetical protein
VAVDARSAVEQVVTADDARVGVGEEGVGVAGLTTEVPRDIGRVDADRNEADPPLLEALQVLLDTP